MKKVLLSLCVAGAGLLSAQTISFEQSEGFFPGDITGQQTEWQSTPIQGGGNVEGQEIVTTQVSDGDQSFYNAELPQYGPQQDGAIIGAFYDPATPVPFESGFTFSYDFYGTEWDAEGTSDFHVRLVDLTAEAYITYLVFSYDGTVKVAGLNDEGTGAFLPTTGTWTVNTWHNLSATFDGFAMTVSLDGEEIVTFTPLNSGGNVEQIRIIHDNYGGDGYYDNIKINETASTSDIAFAKASSAVYPNPAKDVVNIKLAESFNAAKTMVTLTNVSGKKVADFDSVENVSVANLPAGVYILTITDGTNTETKKLIKK